VRALSLRSVSLKSYEIARTVWCLPLPSPRTIRNWANGFPCQPGLLVNILDILKCKFQNCNAKTRLCGLVYDEMSTDSKFIHDVSCDKIFSSSKAQVVIIRGLFEDWIQPIYYDFDTSMSSALLLSIIKACEESGLLVYSVTSDLGADNRSVWKQLHINSQRHYITNPSDENRKIYFFADVPHMLKLIRNHLIDDGVELADGTRITSETLNILLDKNGDEMKLCPRFTQKLLQLSKSERMRVRPASQLLSNHVSKLAQVVMPDQPQVSIFFKTLNDGFDVLNSRFPLDEKNILKSGYGLKLEEQDLALTKLQEMLTSMKFLFQPKNKTSVVGKLEKKKALLPCQEGYLVSISSARELLVDLKASFGVKYILMCRTNQDILESFFSRIRGISSSNSSPSCV